jgi:hypothetical protein
MTFQIEIKQNQNFFFTRTKILNQKLQNFGHFNQTPYIFYLCGVAKNNYIIRPADL